MLFQNWLKTLTVAAASRSSRRDRRKTRSVSGQVVLSQQDFVCTALTETPETRRLLSVNPILVADLVAGAGGSNPSQFVNVNGTLYFSASDGVNGTELWRSDGTVAGTTLVKDIRSGGSASPGSLTNVNGTLFFRANDGTNGSELWQSDGTSAGTTLVKNILSGSVGSSPSVLTNVNGTLFFVADDGVNGVELWQSDGTPTGTTLVKDIRSGSFGSSPNSLTNVNGTLFLHAYDGVNGYELWRSDGTSTGTTLVKDIRSGINSSRPGYLTNVNGTLFFRADDGVNGVELWQSDGTSAGTTLVKDILSGSGNSYPRYLTNVNGTLFFRATDGMNGIELWQSDGTSAGSTLVKNISGSSSSYPNSLTNVNGTLFFTAFDDTNGSELWQSDGTSAGTILVKDIRGGFGVQSSVPGYLTNVNGTLFFRANDGTNGIELWKAVVPADTPKVSVRAFSFLPPAIVEDIRSGSSSSTPTSLTNVNGTLFFNAIDSVHGHELWQSDGTFAGTTVLEDIRSGSGGSDPRSVTNVNGTLFFSANNGVNGYELWQSDGTSIGTTLVKDIRVGSGSSFPQHLTNVNGTLFFKADDGVNGYELWQSDGTSAGTVLVKDILSGSGGSDPISLTNVNGRLFFNANDGVNGHELWQSDGTSLGTILVKDVRSGSGNSFPLSLTNVNGSLFFSANDGVNGYELWQSDGTSSGTTVVSNIRSGSSGSSPRYLTNVNGTLFFRATDGTDGYELWQSDGTTAGTTLVKDIRSGSGSHPQNLTNVNGTLFFSANDGTNGYELWQSDGTSAGTTLVTDILSGNSGSYPNNLANVNGTLFFSADDGTNGFELWSMPVNSRPQLTAFVTAVDTTNEDAEVELTFADFLAQGDESDVDGTVDAFIVQAVSSGTLKIGTSPGSATAFAVGSNDRIDATLNAYWTPDANANGNAIAALTVLAQDNIGDNSLLPVMAAVNVTAVADTPSVSNAATNEDIQTTSGLVISRNAADGAEVTHFKITSITGGTLFQNDGTTAISDNDFITFAQANAGLRFTPSLNSSAMGHFTVQASTSNVDGGLGGSTVTADITVTAVADTASVTNASTNEDVQTGSGLVVSRNAADGAEVTHFKITSITGGWLFQNDGTTSISNGDFVTSAQANAGLKFTPSLNSNATGHFTVQASTSNADAGLGGSTVTADITVTAVADTPSVTNASTSEDVQTSSGLVISRNIADGAEVTHFKITNITGGTLFQNDGTMAIINNDFITFAQANAGLKFTPSLNSNATGHFTVQASTINADAGLGGSTVTADITVTAVADTPSVANASTSEDVQTSSGLVISRNAADGAEVTHFKITSITGGVLFQNDGTMAVSNGDFITFAQANAGLKFTPSLNSNATGHFTVQASTSNADAGLGGSTVTADITVTAVADTPSVTNASTSEDVQTSSGLVISRNIADGAEVTHFKITNITGGTLFQNDGTMAIINNDFITFAQANAGLKFTPSLNSNATGHFTVQASTINADAGLGGSTVTADITVTAVADTPSVTNASTSEDVQTSSGLVISRNAADGAEVTHFKITNITGGTLFQNDGTMAIINNDFITFAQANAGLKFTPSLNSNATGHFTVQASISNADAGLGGSTVTADITVTAVADTPSVTNASTSEDVQTSSGLVISRNIADGTEVTHFKITSITGGTLFQNDGTTAISDNDFITFAQANAGLRFTPSLNSNATGHFTVQGSTSNADAGLGGSTVTADITVTAVADTPSVTNASPSEDVQSTSGLVILRNAADGAEVTHFKITSITGGTLFQNDGTTAISDNEFVTFAQANAGLKFTPLLNSNATGYFTVQASTSDVDAGLGGSTVTADITVSAVADTPSVTNTSTSEDVQTSSGLVISRNAADGAEVTHFKITSITGGTLFLIDGTTAITDNEFITFAQANAGLKFTPSLNSNATGHFTVQASTSNADAGLGGSTVTADITVTAVADTPSVTNASTSEDVQTTSGLVISRNVADGAEVTHFKISSITGGTLFQNDGTTAITENDFITYAQANAGLKFTPSLNFNATGHFTVQASTSNVDGGLGGSTVTADITVDAVADTPSVTNAATFANVQTTSGLVISRNAVDGVEVTHFKITSITGGSLFQNDGTTAVSNGDFITFAQANAGLKFTPTLNSTATGHFTVQASTSNVDGGLGGSTVTADVTVTLPAPTLTGPAAVTTDQRPTISWDPVSGAATYVVYIRNLSTGADPFLLRAVTGTSLTPTSNLGIGSYDVRVRALSTSGDSSFYSQKMNFRIVTPVVFMNVVRFQTSTTPTLSWKPLTGAVKFDLWIDNLSTGQQQVVRDSNVTGTSWTAPTSLPMGSYRAWIRGTDASGLQANWSEFADFFVLPPVTAVSPVNPTFDQTPTFTWNSVPGAGSYDLYYRSLSSGAATIAQTGITGTTFTPSTNLPNGSFRWYVLAVVQGGYRSQSSTVQNFFVGGQPKVLTPQGNNSDTTPTFTWTPVTGAATYDLWVNRIDVATTKIVFQTGLTNTSFTPSTPLPVGNYRIWVLAISTTSQVSLWSQPINFTVAAVTDKLLSVPEDLLLTQPTALDDISLPNRERLPSSDAAEFSVGSQETYVAPEESTAFHPESGTEQPRRNDATSHSEEVRSCFSSLELSTSGDEAGVDALMADVTSMMQVFEI